MSIQSIGEVEVGGSWVQSKSELHIKFSSEKENNSKSLVNINQIRKNFYLSLSFFSNILVTRTRWQCTPLMTTLWRQRQKILWVWDPPGLLSRFWVSHSYTVMPSLLKNYLYLLYIRHCYTSTNWSIGNCILSISTKSWPATEHLKQVTATVMGSQE